jgi:hypothetical protein
MEVGDRAVEGGAYGNLGSACQSQGGYAKAIEYHAQDLAVAKEVGDRAGEGSAYGNLGNALPGDCNGGGRPGGGGRRVREPWQRLPVAGGLCEGHRVPCAGPSGGKGGGRPGGRGRGVREPRQRVLFAG